MSRLIATTFISLVWLVNGLFCKVLDFVPRHEQIVARILGSGHSRFFVTAIGISEILVCIWFLTGVRSRWCSWFQISVVALMNLIEFVMAPDLLLFGKLNALLAFAFMCIVYVNEYFLQPKAIH